MSAPGFFALLRWELRQVGRSRLLWLVLGLLALAMLWGADSGAALHRAQDAAIAQARAADRAWLEQTRERARGYAQPAAEPLPYWQDPTDVAGYSRYFLRAQAYKPNLPSSPLAVGASDLLPTRLPVKLETPFGVEPVYDFEPPRSLGLGRFDLGFVLAYLLPVAAILLAALLGSFERDNGMLRLIAAQRIGPRIWLSARIAAIGLWMAPLVLASLILALCWAGVDARAAWPELAAAAALSLAYLGLWLALAFLVLAAWPSAAGAVGSLVALWAALAIGVPLAADAYARTRYPMPSATALVDAQRRGNDAIAAQRDAIVAAAFARRSDLIGASDRVGSLDYATRMTFLAPELERRLSRLEAQRQAARDGRAQASAFAAYLSPPLGLQSALAQLAGTDAQRHRRFETQVRDYQQRLRDWFYPRIQRQIAAPTPRPAQSRGRQNFGEYDAIPAWAGREPGSEARLRAVLPALLWLALLAAALSFWALRRLRHWPMED